MGEVSIGLRRLGGFDGRSLQLRTWSRSEEWRKTDILRCFSIFQIVAKP